ncbi:MAG TPA: hypothetical protein VF376_06660 [Thermoanaerobaculia bacterium]
MTSTRCWGIYRELAHSPGRETDDAEILRAVAAELSRLGFSVELKTTEELPEETDPSNLPPFLFVMCERVPIVRRLAAWERGGARIVNRPEGIRNTDRERTIALFEKHGVPCPPSTLVSTAAGSASARIAPPCWIKRADVHATEAGDVSFAGESEELRRALDRFSSRGIERAVVQEHVPGDLIKFYGVAGRSKDASPSWFQWFYHRDQALSQHAFDPNELVDAVCRGASALGLEVFGGDAIVRADGRILLIDLNAWPSFALYRQVAAERIAGHLAERFAAPDIDARLAAETQWPRS